MIRRAWSGGDGADLYRAVVPLAVLNDILARCESAKNKETGGILIGHYSQDARTAYVAEATDKPKDSLFGWFKFQRGSHGLKELLAARWKEGLFYLGEWHFHPGGSPEPSHQDHSSMHRIAQDPDYHCQAPLLLIVGGKPPTAVQFSVGVYPIGSKVLRLTDIE